MNKGIPCPAYEKIYLQKALGYAAQTASEQNKPARPSSAKNSLQPWWALIDMNSYFATLEQQSNPFLRGKPIGIIKEYGRSCIIAASKEAKARGIKTSSSLREARQLAPDLITIPADFDKYFAMTRILKEIFEALSPAVEIFSLDEAFIDLSACQQFYPTASQFFETAQTAIQEKLGKWVTFSLGVGMNRLQAKLASDLAGPDSYFEITSDNLDACLAQAKVEDICGIGYRLTEKLHRLQIFHPYQLNFIDDESLRAHFGIFWGPELRRIGRGENSHLLDLVDKPPQHMKSVGRSKTLFQANAHPEYIRQMIYNLAEDMCFKARRMKLAGQHVSLGLRDTEHGWYGGQLRLQTFVRHTDEVFHLLDRIFRSLDVHHKRIIKVSVGLSNLKPLDEITQCWLPEWQKREQVFQAIDKVNEKHGLYTIKSGRLLNFKIVMPEVTGFLGDKTYQFGQYSVK